MKDSHHTPLNSARCIALSRKALRRNFRQMKFLEWEGARKHRLSREDRSISPKEGEGRRRGRKRWALIRCGDFHIAITIRSKPRNFLSNNPSQAISNDVDSEGFSREIRGLGDRPSKVLRLQSPTGIQKFLIFYVHTSAISDRLEIDRVHKFKSHYKSRVTFPDEIGLGLRISEREKQRAQNLVLVFDLDNQRGEEEVVDLRGSLSSGIPRVSFESPSSTHLVFAEPELGKVELGELGVD
ncbi:hypothetical protein Tco_1074166 [Tanacetum coccineum]